MSASAPTAETIEASAADLPGRAVQKPLGTVLWVDAVTASFDTSASRNVARQRWTARSSWCRPPVA